MEPTPKPEKPLEEMTAQEILDSIPSGPPMSLEEVVMSTPYSDRVTWRKILANQWRWGTSRFQGPPGLLRRMERQLSFSMGRAMTSPPSTSSIPTEKT